MSQRKLCVLPSKLKLYKIPLGSSQGQTSNVTKVGSLRTP